MAMELQQLKYFKTVADMGKISDAAQALFVSAPALSTSISRLEKELGTKLFDRTNNSIILNNQGQILLRYVNQVFYNLDSARKELETASRFNRQHVCIASIASTQLVDMITAFSQEHPGFTMQCTSLSRASLKENGLSTQHSFLLAAEEDVPSAYADKLDSVFLYYDHPVVMVHPTHRFAIQGYADLNEMSGETIFMPFHGLPLYEQLTKLFNNNNIPLPDGNAYSHLVTQQMVSKGLGISFATKHTGRTPSTSLCYVPIKNRYQPWGSRLYWRKDHTFTQEEQTFKDFVIQYYRTQED